jgi:hypothetical protein
MVTIFRPFQPNTGRNFAIKSAPSDCLRNYAQDVRLKGGLRILRRFGGSADFWAHHARLPLRLSFLLLTIGYPYSSANFPK